MERSVQGLPHRDILPRAWSLGRNHLKAGEIGILLRGGGCPSRLEVGDSG